MAAGPNPAQAWLAFCRRAPGPKGSIAAPMRSLRCPMGSSMPRRRRCRSRASPHCTPCARAVCCSGASCGASGGVGHLACQLAMAAGAQVWGHVRREEYRAAVAEWCGERVVLGRELAAAKPHGPFWLILDSLGGSALSAALGMLQPGGTCVTFGVSEAAHTTFASRDFFATGGVRLYGLTLFHELMSVERAGIGLALLADLIAAKKLRPQIAVETPWSEIGTVARRLIEREFTGKAVLHIL